MGFVGGGNIINITINNGGADDASVPHVGTTPPTNTDKKWLDTSVSPYAWKEYNGGVWEVFDLATEYYKHEESPASDTWTINHNLGRSPAVTIIDTEGNTVIGEINYVDDDNLILTFTSPVEGIAHLT